jgi:hypothetical protein
MLDTDDGYYALLVPLLAASALPPRGETADAPMQRPPPESAERRAMALLAEARAQIRRRASTDAERQERERGGSRG